MNVAALLTVAALPAAAFEVQHTELRTFSERDAYLIEVHAVLNASPAAVRHVLLNNCEFRDKASYIHECLLFHVDGKTAWAYSLVTPPVLDPRDYVIRRTIVKDLAPDGGGVLRMEFSQDHARSPPQRSGVVRVAINEGHYELHPVDGGKRTRIIYSLTLAPGGYVPLWIAKLAAERATPVQLKRIETNASVVEKRAAVVMPDAAEPWRAVRITPLPRPSMRAP